MAEKYSLLGRLVWCLVQLLTLCAYVTCYTCDIPDDWLHEQAANLWENGVVKYKLHSSLTFKDTTEVKKAFEEFHTKTCIRFEPWQKGDVDFVSIEVNNSVCGAANVCKIGGYQFVHFGKDCRNKANIVHQLGHALCLGHEHQRPDRDEYLNFSKCDSDKILGKIDSYRFPMGIYDYASQMHSKCGTCEDGWPTKQLVDKCGQQISSGLSVLDVDKLNSLYNCRGCQRHRWVSGASYSSKDYPNVHTFGYETKNGTPIYACRTFFEQQVTSGMYDESTNTCKLSWGFKAYEVKDQVEVLTIPGGTVGSDCSVYKVENSKNVQHSSLLNIGTNLIAKEQLFVAYDSINNEKYIGKAWFPSGKSIAEFPVGTDGVARGEFQVLTCSFDRNCMVKKLFSERMLETQNEIKSFGKGEIISNIT